MTPSGFACKTTRELVGYSNQVAYRYVGPAKSDSCSHPFDLNFSADGRLLLAGSPIEEDGSVSEIVIWDVASGKQRPALLRGDQVILSNLSFSPDGRVLAAMRSDCRMALLSSTSGAVVRLLGPGKNEMSAPPAFTPDGRIVMTAVHGLVQLWEVASGGEIARREGHKADVRELVVAPDGRTFATVSADRTVLVWDLTRLTSDAPPATADSLWKDLGSTDAVRGRRAVETLSTMRAKSIALLSERLKPVPPPDGKLVARWIADLDSDDFDTRQHGERELERLAELAGPALAQRLASKPPLESRRRIEGLLQKLDGPAMPTAEVIQAVRAVHVLECVGDAEARWLLHALAHGAAGARLTREARAALARLGAPVR
jgi:WD40 repeat protein